MVEHDLVRQYMEQIAQLEAELESYQNNAICHWCGEWIPLDTGNPDEHYKDCEKHPCRQLEAENERLREYLQAWRQELIDRIEILKPEPHRHIGIHIDTWQSMLDEVDALLESE